jgi:protein TonB
MEFSQQANEPSNLSGLMLVVVLHVVVGYALLNGLAHKVVEVWNKPLGVELIEEMKSLPPPPPPPQKIAPIPKVATPPPAYVPQPEVVVQPAPQQNVIVATTNVPAPPVDVAPQAEPVKPALPAVVAVGVVCPNHVDVRSRVVFPPQAQRMGLSGDVVVDLIVGEAGQISNIQVSKSSNTIFNDAAINAVSQLRCNGVGRDVRVRVPFAFRLER